MKCTNCIGKYQKDKEMELFISVIQFKRKINLLLMSIYLRKYNLKK
jgi:hypothetical protein